MKVAISGKGGVGKTTLAAGLARVLADEGLSVTAIDADPDANLAQAFGLVDRRITPLVEMKALIHERTGAKPGTYGAYFKLNPHVADIPDEYGVMVDGIRLLTLGTIYQGGSGCACPENVFLKALLNHLVLQRDEVVIVDMEAGIEHLGRATVTGIDALIVVVEPGRHSLETARRIESLAGQVGIKRVMVVINKVHSEEQEKQVAEHLNGLNVLGFMHYDDDTLKSDMEGTSPFDASESVVHDVRAIYENLVTSLHEAGKE